MKLKQILTAVASATVLAAASVSSHAATIVIDDFGLPIPGSIINDNDGVADSLVTLNVSAYAAQREITHTLLTAGAIGSNANGNLSSAGTGALPNFLADQFNMSNGNGVDSVVTGEWILNSIAATVSAVFVFDVVSTDPGITGSNNTIEGFFDGVSLGVHSVATAGQITFSLDALQIASLSDGSTFKLVINGADAWDMAIDNLRMEVPEPGSLALAGLALMGLAAARRRKA